MARFLLYRSFCSHHRIFLLFVFFFQAEDGIRDWSVTGVQTCALPICQHGALASAPSAAGPQGEAGALPTMSCHDARELFSARADDALTAPERAALDAHLASCAECRRESERFRATIALLHAVEHPRAPVGFVDRVLGATIRVPRHRRVLRALFLPWRQKLPMEAAAVVLVGVMAVILFKATPDLQRASRVEPPTEAPRREARPVTPVPVAPSAPPREEPPAIVAEAKRDATRQRDLAKSAPAPIRARSVPAEVRGAPADAAAPAPAREAARESAKLSALRPTAADLSGHLVVKDG